MLDSVIALSVVSPAAIPAPKLKPVVVVHQASKVHVVNPVRFTVAVDGMMAT